MIKRLLTRFKKATKFQRLLFFLGLFALINLLQSIFTAISKDEAYYWMFSEHLDWGFFDHPPMVALMIHLGYLVFHNVLGVRLFTVILSALTYLNIWFLIPVEQREKEKSEVIFALLIFAMPICHIYGFITTPDVPLLFFGTLYLLIFKRFILKGNLKNAVLLGIVAALLMYSKYHGALIIILSLIPYYKVLKNFRFYLAGLIGIALFIPHIVWEYNHDFVSIIYQLNYRSDNVFEVKNILDYILNVLLIMNPFLVVFLFYYLIKKKIELEYRSLKFLFWGVLIFFGFNSFKNHVEPHWVAISVIPGIIMFHTIAINNLKTQKILVKLMYFTIPLFFILRILLILPLNINTEFHQEGREYFEKLANFVKDKDVVFLDSYSRPAKYTFYTGKDAFTSRTIFYHKTQYDFWDYDKRFHKKSAILLKDEFTEGWLPVDTTGKIKIRYRNVNEFLVINNLKITINNFTKLNDDSTYQVNFDLYNPYEYNINFKEYTKPYQVSVVKFCKNGDKTFMPVSCNIGTIKSGETINATGTFKAKNLYLKDQVGITVAPGELDALLLSNKYKFKTGNY